MSIAALVCAGAVKNDFIPALRIAVSFFNEASV